MSECPQIGITDDSFTRLANLTELDVSESRYIDQHRTISCVAFSHLKRLKKLTMRSCLAFTDECFSAFTELRTLCMSHCNQSAITNAAFSHLSNLRVLDMSYCNQAAITNAAFSHLSKLIILYMHGCNQEQITVLAFEGLYKYAHIDIRYCTQLKLPASEHKSRMYHV
jgi:Leucine-rich repeat (LRR) protein